MCLSIGPTSCFYWASKLPRGTFWAGLKTFKSLAGSSFRRPQHRTTLRSSSRSVLLALPWCLHVPFDWPYKLFLLGFETAAWHVLGRPYNLQKPRSSFRRLQHRTTLRSSSRSVLLCFYWASKLPRGTFWAGLKTLKSLAAAFEGLSTAQPSAAAFEVCCWFCHGASLLAPKAVSIGLRNCRVSRSRQALKPSKASQQLSKASAPHNPPQQLSKCAAGLAMVPPYWFWARLKTFKSLAAAFEGLSTAQPSAAALEASRLLCHGASLLAPKAVSIGLRNCRVARFGQALKPSKASQQLSQASAPHNPPQQLSKRPAGFAMVPPCAFLTLRSSSRSVLLALPYWRQKLFLLGFETAPWRGTFWAGLKTEGLSTAQPSAAKASQQLSKASAPHNPLQQLSKRPAGFAMVPPCAFLLALQAVSIGLRNCRVARFGQALKPSKASQLSKASAPHNPPQQLSKCAAGFAMVPPYWPQKLFPLGFETAAWHVLGRP